MSLWPRRAALRMGAGAVAGLLTAGPPWGGGRPALAQGPVVVASAVSLLRPAVPPREARKLEMRDGEKRLMRLGELAAGRAVLLNLWAPWCLPCRREMPSLAALAQALGTEGPLVLPLAFDWRGASGVRRFYREIGVSNLPVWLGEGENLMAVLGLENLPTTALINREGHMVQLVAGEAVWDDAATLDWAKAL